MRPLFLIVLSMTSMTTGCDGLLIPHEHESHAEGLCHVRVVEVPAEVDTEGAESPVPTQPRVALVCPEGHGPAATKEP
jgi:hypothetical protein